jgi:ABC-type sulfate/molybdate transport systems ATPase subunit
MKLFKNNKMPLKNGKSKKVISSNVEELLHEYKHTGTIGTSHPESMEKAQKQAVAIAYSKAKKNSKDGSK